MPAAASPRGCRPAARSCPGTRRPGRGRTSRRPAGRSAARRRAPSRTAAGRRSRGRLLLALARDVGAEDLADAVGLVDAPRVVALEHRVELRARVHDPRVDRRERLLAREPPLARGEAELLAQQVHHVGAVALVEHREAGGQAERAAVEAEQPVGDRVERAAPDAAGVAMAALALGALEHLAGGAPAEGQQQDALRADAALQQAGRRARPGSWSCRCPRRPRSAAVPHRGWPRPVARD